MPVPGYDPEDVDDTLESQLDDGEVEARLNDDELEAYRAGEESLVDLLDEAEIERIVGDGG